MRRTTVSPPAMRAVLPDPGTDGPTDAAGGYVDGGTFDTLLEKGIRLADALQNNDSYHALEGHDRQPPDAGHDGPLRQR